MREDVKGYIFDYGGTLDTRGNHWGKVIWHAYQRNGIPVSENDYRDAYVHAERTLGRNHIIMPDYTFRDTLNAKLRIQLEWLSAIPAYEAMEKEAEVFREKLLEDLYSSTINTVSESRTVLEVLASKHPLVLVSNFYGNINAVLKEFSLSHLFDTVIESAVVGIRKPDPRIFALGVEALGFEPQDIVVVGDSLDKDILPALSIGCQAIWFKGEPWTEHNETKQQTDYRIINNLIEIINT